MTNLDANISNAELERLTGVNRGNLWSVAAGEKGLSLDSSRAVCKMTGNDRPLALYLQTQRRAIKHKSEAGERGAALRGAAAVLDELKTIPKDQLDLEAEEFKKTRRELHNLMEPSYDFLLVSHGRRRATPKP